MVTDSEPIQCAMNQVLAELILAVNERHERSKLETYAPDNSEPQIVALCDALSALARCGRW